MVSRLLIFSICSLGSVFAFAQKDTVLILNEIPVYGKQFQRFSTGGNYHQVDTIANAITLTDALSGESSIYFKGYGNKQLTTIAFRGTSASQTSVLWHGVPANYPTLGQMDFSQWPAWFISTVAVQAGSGGALYGSGAVGGTVLIDSDVGEEQPSVTVGSSLGSFGALLTAAKTSYRTGKWSGTTALLRDYLKNDFSYHYNGDKYTQKNAAVLNYGFQQKINYRFSDRSMLSLDGQYTKNDREVQPSMTSPSVQSHLVTENIRVALDHELTTTRGSLSTVVAFLQDNQLYNETDRTKSNQLSALAIYWSELTSKLSYRVGGNMNGYMASSANYPENFKDFQSAVFLSLDYHPWGWWSSVINLRQSFYKNNLPFTPSIGNEWSLIQAGNHQLSLGQGLSWGFRYPTLNDLHWEPGGNPDLKPEKSVNLEGTLKWKYDNGVFGATAHATAYHIWSANWIIWLAGASGIWSPYNYRDVEISGLEWSGSAHSAVWSRRDELTMNVSYTQSINQTGSTSGNQLPYVPVWQGNAQLKSSFRGNLSLRIDVAYTGLRYTTLSNSEHDSINPYCLTNLMVGKNLQLSRFRLELTASVKNVLNETYQNMINYAMPGRNYELKLLINYQ